jgi:hypothetical protein
MDWKDAVVVGAALFGGSIGLVFGPGGMVGGVLVGAGLGARWASRTDREARLERRVAELEARVGTEPDRAGDDPDGGAPADSDG